MSASTTLTVHNLKPIAEPRLLLSGHSSPVWMPDGKEIVFLGQSSMSSGLRRMVVSKPAKPQKLAFASNDADEPAVSRQGKRLAYAVGRYDYNIWQLDLGEPGEKSADPIQFISSTQQEYNPAYSPDGKSIAFVSNRSGTDEIWVCDSDGSKRVKLTSLGGGSIFGPEWSPDSQSIAFWGFPRGGGSLDIYVIDANGGAPKRLTTDQGDESWPNWSRDGHWLYFSKGGEIWQIPSKGGKEIQVTRDHGADWPHESPDGKWLYYSKGWPNPQSVWRMPVEGGESTKVLDAVHPTALWTKGKDGIYFFTVPEAKGHKDLNLKEFATGNIRKIRTIERQIFLSMTVSADGRTILYSQLDEVGSDLMLVENFR
jgi:eukaryotic-like serine/threonine-protein kinase